jgi:FkbH-like protein
MRDEIDRLIASGDGHSAASALANLWRQSLGPATAGFVVGRIDRVRELLSLTSCRVAILRSFTVEPAIPLLRAMGFVGGIDLEVRLGDFNAYAQEILDRSSWLYSWKPDVVILAVQTRDVSPALWDGFADLDTAGVEAEVGRTIEMFQNLLSSFRAASSAHLIVHSLQIPTLLARGLLDSCGSLGQSDAIRKINGALHNTARAARNVYVLDYNSLIARRGETAWHDQRKWLMARMPIAAGELVHLAAEWLRFLHPIAGRICKLLAVDLDNTLWGGVIGEDGIDGIKLDDNYPGATYRDVQRALLDLHRRGILLAICSKNNPAEAMEVIEKHPGMLLKPGHFSAIRINWADKAENLRQIAAELNVGLDSVAFLDDNPVEREWIRTQIPEVTVVELPADPMTFAPTLRECPVFERLELTEADQSRGRLYAEQRQRTQLAQTAASLEDFYRSLQMRARVEPVNYATLARAAQLTQKTNQFNLTTRRYNHEQLAQLLKPSLALAIQVTDRFGDYGIVGVAILRIHDGLCEIDTFLLSCRVIGRTIETAFLAAITREAIAAGAGRLVGWFIPTMKNAPAATFYENHGFARTRENEGAVLWELDLTTHTLAVPPWITMEGTTS